MAALSGAQIPTTTMQTMTGSPLSAIAGLGTLAGGMFSKNASGTSVAGNIYDAIGAPLVQGAKDAYRYVTNGNPGMSGTGDVTYKPTYGAPGTVYGQPGVEASPDNTYVPDYQPPYNAPTNYYDSPEYLDTVFGEDYQGR